MKKNVKLHLDFFLAFRSMKESTFFLPFLFLEIVSKLDEIIASQNNFPVSFFNLIGHSQCCTHLEVLHPKGLSHHEKLPGIIGEYMIAPELINGQPQFINDRRYWKSIYDHGAYAIWNCGLHWSIGSIDDLGSCLSWAHSGAETGVNISVFVTFHVYTANTVCVPLTTALK